jgi:hypothetical protein
MNASEEGLFMVGSIQLEHTETRSFELPKGRNRQSRRETSRVISILGY